MGGVLGMIMAADPNTRKYIDRLVINDEGASRRHSTDSRISAEKKIFKNLEESEKFLGKFTHPSGIYRSKSGSH